MSHSKPWPPKDLHVDGTGVESGRADLQTVFSGRGLSRFLRSGLDPSDLFRLSGSRRGRFGSLRENQDLQVGREKTSEPNPAETACDLTG